MSFKNKISLVVSLLLTGGIIAYAQQAPTAPPLPPEPPDSAYEYSFFLGGGSFLGVYTENVDKTNAGRYGLREPKGVAITSVVSGSPAEKAGLRKDDVILRFDGESVTSTRKLNRLVSEVAPDQTVRVVISRGGAEQEVAVTMAERKNSYSNTFRDLFKGQRGGVWTLPPGDHEGFVFSLGNSRRIGVTTTNLTKQLAEYFGVTDGVLVTGVTDDSPAAKAGVRAGDVITAVDGEKVDGAGDLTRAINKKKDGTVTLTVVRNKSQLTLTLTPTQADSGFGVDVPEIDVSLPEINVQMPRIVIPDIKVNVPPKRVRVGRIGSQQPI